MFYRIGSDEDDEDADESQSADDLSETAVSRNAKMEDYNEQNDRVECDSGQEDVLKGRQEPLGDASPSEPVSLDSTSDGDADQGAQVDSAEKMNEGSDAKVRNLNICSNFLAHSSKVNFKLTVGCNSMYAWVKEIFFVSAG